MSQNIAERQSILNVNLILAFSLSSDRIKCCVTNTVEFLEGKQWQALQNRALISDIPYSIIF